MTPWMTGAIALLPAVMALLAGVVWAQDSVPAREGPPLPKSDDEKAILAVLDELDHDRRGTKNVPSDDGRLLRMMAEAIGAQTVVELGTSNGYSGIWFCLALRRTGGHLYTFDSDEGLTAMARQNWEKAGVASLITLTMGDAHETVRQLPFGGPIDLLFIDADKPGYLDYLNQLRTRVRPGGLILSHNMKNPPPDPKFVEAITTDPDLETLFVHMDNQGMGITLKKL